MRGALRKSSREVATRGVWTLVVGSLPVNDRPSTAMHRDMRLAPTVCGDEFKVAGHAEHVDEGWSKRRGFIAMGETTPLGK